MSDEHSGPSGETRSPLEQVLATPVGRRSVLKAGLGTAAALGVGLPAEKASARTRSRRHSRRAEKTDLHFAFGHVHGVTRLTLIANGKHIPLSRHTKHSRSELRRRGGLWGKADLSKLSHHVRGVELPADQALLISVHGKRGRRDVLVGQMWRAPRASIVAFARSIHRRDGSYRHALGSPRRLAALGLKHSQIRSAEQVAQLEMIVDPYTSASGFVSLHPNIANKTLGEATNALLGAKPAVGSLGDYIALLQSGGTDYITLVQATNPDGSLTQVTINQTTVPLQTYQLVADKKLPDLLTKAVTAGIRAVRNDKRLGAVINKPLDQDPSASTRTWVQPEGVIPQSQPVSRSGRVGATFAPQVKNPGVLFGTQTVAGSFTANQVDLTLYNNWVRWVWVYVQYLGKGNENLSLNPNPTWPDTKYAQSLGVLPQVWTVLGVPIWDTNQIKVTLNFPAGAHTARILYCGLGSDLLDGSWRQYFPAEAYPDAIAPQDEVLFSSLFTGIATIGLTVFALGTDMELSSTWTEIRKYVEDFLPSRVAVLQALSRSLVLRGTEVLATSVAAGVATHDSIAGNGGSPENIWTTLLPLASAIPKLLFTPGLAELWGAIARIIGGSEAVSKFADALPIFGQVFSILSAVGDAVTLAEVCAETIVAPWVIENEVALTYPATVTVNRDPRDATFPKTAVSYQLEAKVDGAVALTPLTGTVNPSGVSEPGPLVLPVTAPFGGQTIQWSVVFLNARGVQVGTGVSAQFTNNDPNNPPAAVPITITELPVPIDSHTVFKRRVTTTYSAAAGGYTWSDKVVDSGALARVGNPLATSTTVSTLAGVAGVVWEQDKKYYVRGVPVAQSGATISLGRATHEGYLRRPFLLFDAFVGKGDQGNHVLLEPDASTEAYNVRKVTLDPTTGAPTWDTKTSYGTFLKSVSAAALHSSGRVVAVHTDTGRFGWLNPVDTLRAPLAAYSAGPGSQVGLLGSPIAIAVTNPGVVIVLEASGPHGPQLSAFDLNGNPIPYFQPPVTRRSLVTNARSLGAAAKGNYRLTLVSSGTYLDLAVDGSGNIYVLYHTGAGTSPGDYRIDVYTKTGSALDTHSPGVDVPHFAIDYWRSIYAANYDPLTDLGTDTGKPHIDPDLGVAEPSLSRFDPEENIGIGKPTKKHGSKPKPKHPHKHKTKHQK